MFYPPSFGPMNQGTVATFRCAICALWYRLDDKGRDRPPSMGAGSECVRCFTPSLRGKPLDPIMWGKHGTMTPGQLIGVTYYEGEYEAGLQSITDLSISETHRGLTIEGVKHLV